MIGSCFCTIAFQQNKWGKDRTIERPIETILPLLADAGYDAVEIWAPAVEHHDTAALNRVRDQLHELRLTPAMLSHYYDFTTSDQSAAESVALARRMHSVARQLGCPALRVFTGKTGSADATDDQWNRTADALRTLADESRCDGIAWALETHPRNLMDTVPATRRLLERIDRDNVWLIFQPSTFAKDLDTAAETLLPYSRHLHITNNKQGKACPVYEGGDIDYTAFALTLKRLAFSGYASIEWMGPDAPTIASHSAPWLKGTLCT